MDRSSGNDHYKAYLALQKSRRTKQLEPIRNEIQGNNSHVANNPHVERTQRQIAAPKIQGLVRGFLTRQQIAKDRTRSVLVTNPHDGAFGDAAKALSNDGRFDVFAPNPDGKLIPFNDSAKRRLAKPEHTAVLLHGRSSHVGPEVSNLGSFKAGLKNRSAEAMKKLLSEARILPVGDNRRITSLACWSGADNTSHRKVKNNPTSYGQKLASATGMPVTAPNGPLAVGGKTGGDLPFGSARVNLNLNDTGQTTSRVRSFSEIVEGETALHRETTKKRGGMAWRRFQP